MSLDKITPDRDLQRLLGLAGMARKAGRIVTGCDRTCDQIRNIGDVVLVLAAEDISANTEKRIKGCCSYHGVRLAVCGFTTAQLGDALGREGVTACAGITDSGFAKAMLKLIPEDKIIEPEGGDDDDDEWEQFEKNAAKIAADAEKKTAEAKKNDAVNKRSAHKDSKRGNKPLNKAYHGRKADGPGGGGRKKSESS